MTGTLQVKKLNSGKSYYYVKLSYKDPRTQTWKSKTLSTKLEEKNNKRKAENMIRTYIDQYSYLEELPMPYSSAITPNITLNDYLDLWLQEKEHHLKISTYEAYVYRSTRIKKYFESQEPKLIEVTPRMLDVFFKYSLKYGKINQKTKEKEPLSVRSVRSYKSILYALFDQAVIDGLIKQNPVVSVKVAGKKNHEYSEELLFLTEDEVSDLLHLIAEQYPRLLGIAFMGAYYGLRRSEILGLKWSAIDFNKKTLSIEHTVVRVKTTHAEDSTKTHSSKRILNLFETAEKCLQQLYQEQQENKLFFGATYKNKDNYIFTWEDGSAYAPDYISKSFQKATKQFGRPEITLHKLRHSCASMLINKGWDLKKLQYWLGHSDAQTTLNIYAHFNRQRLNTSTNDLSEISLASSDLFV
jgi:integrase